MSEQLLNKGQDDGNVALTGHLYSDNESEYFVHLKDGSWMEATDFFEHGGHSYKRDELPEDCTKTTFRTIREETGY